MALSTETAISKDVQVHLDSLVREQVAAQLGLIAVVEDENITDIVVFDTDKPLADSTGLPPVKAILHRQAKRAQRSQEWAAVQAETYVQSDTEVTDRSVENIQTEQVDEKKPNVGIGVLRTGIGALLLAVALLAIWIFYKRIKR